MWKARGPAGAALQRNHFHATRQGGNRRACRRRSPGLTLALSTPMLSGTTACPTALLAKSVPVGTAHHNGHWPADGQNADVGQGLGIQQFQRAGQDRRAAGILVVDGPAVLKSMPPRTTLPPPPLSITRNWPGPVRAYPMPLLLSQAVWPLPSTVATLLAAVPSVMGMILFRPLRAGLERSTSEVEDGLTSAGRHCRPGLNSSGTTRR